MKKPVRRSIYWFPASMTCVAAAALVACSSDDVQRPTLEEEPEAGRPPPASLPEAAAPEEDAGARQPEDAGPGKDPFDPTEEPVVCATTPCAVQIVAGERHFCTRMSDGTVRCWGDDSKGSLGVDPDAGASDPGVGDAGDAGTPWVPKPVTGLTDASQLSAGGTTTCAVVTDGNVRCWGGNDKGQLGLAVDPPVSDTKAHPAPTPVARPGPASRVDVGQVTACAVLASGEVWCWGDNAQRQLARLTTTTIGGPGKAALGAFDVVRTTAGTATGFGVTDTGEIVSWGAVAGTAGVVGARVASLSPDERPLAIGLGPASSFSVTSTTSNRAHACAVVKGDVYCWGSSSMGSLGTGLADPSPKPRRVNVVSKEAWPQQVAAAGEISCVRLTDGTVQCAGDNGTGALGMDPKATPYSMSFRPVDSFDGHAVQIAATASRSVCALVQGGSVLCWGSNQRGELGQGNTDNDPHHTPVSVRF